MTSEPSVCLQLLKQVHLILIFFFLLACYAVYVILQGSKQAQSVTLHAYKIQGITVDLFYGSLLYFVYHQYVCNK